MKAGNILNAGSVVETVVNIVTILGIYIGANMPVTGVRIQLHVNMHGINGTLASTV